MPDTNSLRTFIGIAVVTMAMSALAGAGVPALAGAAADWADSAVAIVPRTNSSNSTKPAPAKPQSTANNTSATAPAATKLLRDKPGPPPLGEGSPVFDRIMNDGLMARSIPGGALAIVKNGRLVLAKGYGLANTKTREPVSLQTLFCTASVTKTVTAAAVLRLVDQGKLSLDDPVYALLGKPRPLGRALIDSQIEKITVRQLLLHSGGWNARNHGDVLRQTQKIARLAGEKSPVSADAVMRYGLTQPLDFVPGTESHYSNFCYFLAKRVIERVAKQPYETYVRQQVLRPMGITDMRLEQLAPAYVASEAHRYRSDGRELLGGRELITAPAGCWLATVVDLARILANISGTHGKPLLSTAAHDQMFAVPPPPLSPRKSGSHIGLGWDSVQEGSAGLEYHKTGIVSGVRVYVEHVAKDIDWVLMLNSDGTSDDQSTAVVAITGQIRSAIDATHEWPDRDLFVSK